jgi:hypothetical protein
LAIGDWRLAIAACLLLIADSGFHRLSSRTSAITNQQLQSAIDNGQAAIVNRQPPIVN